MTTKKATKPAARTAAPGNRSDEIAAFVDAVAAGRVVGNGPPLDRLGAVIREGRAAHAAADAARTRAEAAR